VCGYQKMLALFYNVISGGKNCIGQYGGQKCMSYLLVKRQLTFLFEIMCLTLSSLRSSFPDM